MKRYGKLFLKIVDIDNIMKAHDNARKGKTHYRDVKLVDKCPGKYAIKIREMLLNKSYEVGEYDVLNKVVDNGKLRTIYRLNYYPHRIIHHSILQVLEPIWKKSMIVDTFCCIKGRGIHRCAKKLKHRLRENITETKYCLKLDIKKFYPNVDNIILKKVIRKKIKDGETLWLLDKIIDSSNGLPIGNYLSQYLSNLYLSGLDHWCKEILRIRDYYRYCDDIVILHNDKRHLHQIRKEIAGYLQKKLKLEVNKNWQIFPVAYRGVDFLGYRFFHGYTLLRKNIVKKVLSLSKKIEKRGVATHKEISSMMSYYGWMKHCNSMNLRRKVFNDRVFKAFNVGAKASGIRNPLKGLV